MRQAIATLVFAGGIAGAVVFFGTRDLESYEHAFFSLDRGTRVESVQVLGHPVYTYSVGLGVRLPLQSSFGASPVSAAARILPAPVSYWLLITVSFACTLLVLRHALEPLCGRLVTWIAALLVFCSVPIVTYAVYNDWPDVTFTYSAMMACVFAPQALLATLAAPRPVRARTIGALSVAALTWGAVALSHPGYWPHIAATLVGAAGLALVRSDLLWRHRLVAVALLAVVTLLPVAAQVPDILRELNIPGADTSAIGRYTEPPEGALVAANLFPFGILGSRMPFSHLLLALLSLVIGATSIDRQNRRLSMGAALLSIGFAIGASTLPAGSAAYSPTGIWTLRDPAAGFAILAAAAVVAGLRSGGTRLPVQRLALAALLVVALQGPAYAARLVLTNFGGPQPEETASQWRNQGIWTRDMTSPAERVRLRGLVRDPQPAGQRLALWPGVRGAMRTDRVPATDFADAGYTLVTAWTKQRTMRGLVRPNEQMFNQAVELAPEILCNPAAIAFLQLRYLVAPPATTCEPWTSIPGVRIDGRYALFSASAMDERVRTLAATPASDQLRLQPALVEGSPLLRALEPVNGSAVRLEPPGAEIRLEIRLNDPAATAARTLVLPVAYDEAWQASDGRAHNVGGLLALTDVRQPRVTLEWVPDRVAWLRAGAMAVAQILTLLGFIGLVSVRPVPAAGPVSSASLSGLRTLAVRWREMTIGAIRRPLRQPRYWLYIAYTAGVVWALPWVTREPNRITLAGALILPLVALGTARLTQLDAVRTTVGSSLFALALLSVGVWGSLSSYALSDPLFWAVVSAGALLASLATRRWRIAARTLSAVAGATVMMAVLLGTSRGVEAARGFDPLARQFGFPAALSLLALCLQGVAHRDTHRRDTWHLGAAARAALLTGVLLVLAGGVSAARIDGVWLVVLGVLLGLAESTSRERRPS